LAPKKEPFIPITMVPAISYMDPSIHSAQLQVISLIYWFTYLSNLPSITPS